MNEQDLFGIKQEMEEAKIAGAKIDGQIQSVQERLFKERGVPTIAEAKELLSTMQSDLVELESEYEKGLLALEEKFEWED